MRKIRPRAAILYALVVILTACGGGSGGNGSNGSSGSSVALTDAPASQYNHVWITVQAIWFHESATADPEDTGWVKFPLASPETFDLIQLANGNLATAFSGLNIPVGNYQQVRLFLDSPSDALQASATADSLSYNDQVNYTDSTGATQVAPLEVANPEAGIGIVGQFDVTSGSTLSLALDFDATNDVLQFDVGSQSDFVLKPRLAYFDLSSVGAIVGSLNSTQLASATNSAGASNLVIKAEVLSSDGTYHTISRLTSVKADGSFTLFPLSVPAGSASTTYDVVIRGKQMQTIIIKNVKVSAGTGPASGQNPTQIQTDPIAITADTDFTANEAAAQPASPTSQTVLFYQTLQGTGTAEVPYAIRIRETDPFTGTFYTDFPLSVGPLEYGNYNAGANIALSTTTPVEGAGSFQVFGNAGNYVRTAAAANVTAPATPTTTAVTFTIPSLTVASPAVADSIGGSLTLPSAGKYNAGYMIVTHMGDIVTTIPLGPVLALNGSLGGAFTLADLPGGSSSATFADGRYHISVLLWNTNDPLLSFLSSLLRLPLTAVVDLRNGSATGVNFVVQ